LLYSIHGPFAMAGYIRNMAVLLPVMATMVGGAGAMVPHSSAAARLDRASCLRLRGGGNVLSKLQDILPLVQRSGPKIIISGAPASGKGTQCELIVEKFGVVKCALCPRNQTPHAQAETQERAEESAARRPSRVGCEPWFDWFLLCCPTCPG